MSQTIFRIKNWAEFQHYKDRRPPWIKLHRQLLDDYEFHRMSDASRAILPCLWLIASEFKNGEIESSVDSLAFRLHVDCRKLDICLKELKTKGFIEFASIALASCEQVAIPEERREEKRREETEREIERDIVAKTATATDRFDEFWACYPKRVGKEPARKAWTRIAGANGLAGEIIEGIARWKQNRQWDDPRFIPNPATFLNQRRWEDEVPADSKMLTDREREYKREASVGAGPEVPQGTRLETSEFTLEELHAEIARSKARRKKPATMK